MKYLVWDFEFSCPIKHSLLLVWCLLGFVVRVWGSFGSNVWGVVWWGDFDLQYSSN